MTWDGHELETTYFSVLGVNISQTVRTAVARLPLRQLGFLIAKLFLLFVVLEVAVCCLGHVKKED